MCTVCQHTCVFDGQTTSLSSFQPHSQQIGVFVITVVMREIGVDCVEDKLLIHIGMGLSFCIKFQQCIVAPELLATLPTM